MKRQHFILALLAAALLVETLYGQSQHANNARGFNANDVYSGFNVDSINHFNGNLIVTIPIGQTYPVNGSLSYSLRLVYNSFIWTQESICDATSGTATISSYYGSINGLRRRKLCDDGGAIVRPCRSNEQYEEAYSPALINPYVLVAEGQKNDRLDKCQPLTSINPASNAGIGWQLHLGKIFRPLSSVKYAQPVTTEKLYEVYQSPDGSEHQFYERLHGDDPPDSANYFYTRDGSYLRMWKNLSPAIESYSPIFNPDNDTYRIEFPNGEIHHFQTVRVQDTVTSDGNGNILFLPYYEDKLVRIEDRLGNYVAIDYFDDGTDGDSLKDNRWEITDSVDRRHTVNFIKSGALTLISSINMQTVGLSYDTYTLDYATGVPTDIAIPHAWQGFFPGYNTGTNELADKMLLPYLTAVHLPDRSQYSMPMNTSNLTDPTNAYLPDIQRAGALAPGALVKMTLPTGGHIEWDYFYPDRNTDNGYGYYFSPGISGRQHARVAPGVRRRRVYTGAGQETIHGTWSYDPHIGNVTHDGCTMAVTSAPCGAYQIVNRVTQPTGDYTDYFFSIYPHPEAGSRQEGRGDTVPHVADYGLPFTKSPVDYNGAPNIYQGNGTLFLSSRTYAVGGVPKRTNYVRYEGDQYAFTDGFGNTLEYNPRMVASLTVYDDDPGRYAGVRYSDFDGLGHYRKTETFGNIGSDDARVEITNFNNDRGTYLIDSVTNLRASITNFYTPFPEGQPWVLGRYSYQLASHAGQRSVTFFNFNPDNGLLRAKRTRKDIEQDSTDYSTIRPNDVSLTLGAKDVLVQYNYFNGNVSSESYFGGEKQAGLPIDVTFPGLANSGSEYKIDIGYLCQKGGGGQSTTSVASNKSYRVNTGEVNFLVLDNTVDCSTGLPISSRDTAGVETQYTYGEMSRLRFIKNSQGSYDEITYSPHVGVNGGRPRVTVSRRPNRVESGATSSEDIYIYDELGRLVTEKKRQPPVNTYQLRNTNYNAMNWVTAVSEWVDEGAVPDGKVTRYSSFDVFGRAGRIDQPDGKFIIVGYTGDRQVTRSVTVGYQLSTLDGTVSEQNSTTRETYDRHGRLTQLTEPSGAAGQNRDWTYAYGVNNKLAWSVVTDPSGTGATQRRSFGYDNLGNLLTQILPEVPWSQFADYDTMNNVGTTNDGKHWLKYSYDSNARIKEIMELDEPAWLWRTVKSYSYYSANNVDANGNPSPGNWGKGKMSAATRINRVGNPYEVVNVAAGKAATQSSTWGGISASNAVDGNTNGNYFSHTDYNNQAWWQVDLGASYSLEEIKIWNRTDCCQERLSNFYVLVSDTPFVSTDLATARNQAGVSSYYVSGQAGTPTNLSAWRTGRYVRVQLVGANYLSLAEVQVTASSVNLYDIGVTEQYTYNGVDGRLGRQVTRLNASGPKPYSFDQTFTYDELGNLRSQSYPQCTNPTCASASQTGGSRSRPWTVNYQYAQGWLTSVGANASLTDYASSITYNRNGSLQSITHSNGLVDTWGQDPNYMQRPASIDVRRSGSSTSYWNSGPYRFDGAGNVTRIGNDWYLYDKVSRVVEGSVLAVGAKKRYGYDAFGNTLTVTTFAGVTTPTNGSQSGPVFNSNTRSDKNQYTLNYDAAGNTLGVLGAAGQPNPSPIYVYDGMNMIKSVPGSFITHLYGPDDERVWTLRKQPGPFVTETVTLRGLNNEVLREYQVNNGDELNQWQWVRDYVYAGSRLLAAQLPGGGVRHYHLDHLGTPRVITDGAGNAVYGSPYQYFPFGDEASAEPPPDEKLRFTGHERDTNDPFRLDYMHRRYYYRGGSAGKFMSVDPGKDWDPRRPQSWNLYTYALSNPLGYTDPDGRDYMAIFRNNGTHLNAGHAAYRVWGKGYDFTFSFGGWHGINFFTGRGLGSVQVFTDFNAFLKQQEGRGTKIKGLVLHTTPEQDQAAISYFVQQIQAAGNQRIATGPGFKEFLTAMDYNLYNNSCLTTLVDGLKWVEKQTGTSIPAINRLGSSNKPMDIFNQLEDWFPKGSKDGTVVPLRSKN